MRPKTEDTLHPIQSITLTTTCLIVCGSRDGSAFFKLGFGTPTAERRCHRETHRGEMAHHCSARGNRVPRARILDGHFYVTHCGGCAVLFNKDTSHSNIKVTSVYLHDTRNGQQQIVREGQLGWVLQAVISRASFRRLPRNGKSFFTTMSLPNSLRNVV